MADDAAAAAEERRKRAQARKDKIANRGADRLAKITGASKGEGSDGGERFGTGGASPRPTASRTASGAGDITTARATLPASAAPSFNPLDDPPEVDISTLQRQEAFNGIPGFPPQAGMGSDGTMPDMPDMLSALLGGQGFGGAGGDGAGGLPEQFAQMFGGAGGPGGGGTPIALQPPREKTWTDRLLPLVHLVSMVSLAFWAVFVLEPRVREGYSAFSGAGEGWKDFLRLRQPDVAAWATLGSRHPVSRFDAVQSAKETWQTSVGGGVVGLPLLYLFLTLELMLQGAVIVLFKTKPPIPSLLNSFMPYLPPKLSMYAHTGIKYWALLGQFLDDLAVLVLSLVGWILYAEWQASNGDMAILKGKIE